MESTRIVYMLESFTDDGTLVYRLFAANKKTAMHVARMHKNCPQPEIRKLSKSERDWINPSDVLRVSSFSTGGDQ